MAIREGVVRAVLSPMTMLLVLIASGPPVTGAQSQPDLFESLYARSQARQATTHSVGARFTETTVSSLLVQPIVARGTVVAAQPGRMVMHYTSPEPRTVVVNGDRLVVYWPQRNHQEVQNIAQTQARVQKYFAGASPTELRGFFDITASLDPRGTYLVELKPRRKQINEGLELLQIWVDQETTLMARMRIVFPDGDSKEIQLEDVQINVPAGDEIFAVPAAPARKR